MCPVNRWEHTILLKYVAIPSAIVNTFAMILSSVAHQPVSFLFAWAGASLATYGALYYAEREDVATSGYLDIARRLAWEIREGNYQPGDRLPGTKKIAERFQTTRTTVARAVKVLAEEGILLPIKGRGLYVVGAGGEIGRHNDKAKDRIANHIHDQLMDAEPGTQMPGTLTLADQFDVHPVTVKRVQAELVDEGLLKRSRSGNYFKP